MQILVKKSHNNDIFVFYFETQTEKDVIFDGFKKAYDFVKCMPDSDIDYSIVDTLYNRIDDKYANDTYFESGFLYSSEMVKFVFFLIDCIIFGFIDLIDVLKDAKEALDWPPALLEVPKE